MFCTISVNSKKFIPLKYAVRFGVLLFAYILISCKDSSKSVIPKEKLKPSAELKTIADTITYDVMLRAIDTSDTWVAECLQYLNQKDFINYLFDGIYSKQFTAYDFFTGEPLSPNDVREIEHEDDFSRELVSKVQFKEHWYIDSTGHFHKDVLNYTLGIEAYSKQKSFLGHRALFVVKPNF